MKILISGGTGSFGKTALKYFLLNNDISEIRIFSRDEKKQDDLRKEFNDKRINLILGDIRDKNSIFNASKGVNRIFHAAALKQVPSCEFYPEEAVKTNILGTINILSSAIENKIEKVICLSTDKAVMPINAMGISKAMMEKIAVSHSLTQKKTETEICITRYGNVMASRGSVIPLFIDCIKKKIPITITVPGMTRFLMSLKDAFELVEYAINNGKNGHTYIRKAPSATIKNIAIALLEIFDKPNHPIEIIGSRHSEKIHETLITAEERARSIENQNYYTVMPDSRDQNYNLQASNLGNKLLDEYTSENTEQLNLKNLKELLLTNAFIQEELKLVKKK